MRKLVLFVFVTMVTFTAFATEENPTKQEIRSSIVKLLGNIDFKMEDNLETSVDFLINKKGEIVILEVKSNSPIITNYVKTKLNYKKVFSNPVSSVQIYRMPLKFVKS